MKKEIAAQIRKEYKCCVLNTIARLKKTPEKKQKPFHSRLLCEDIMRASLFERSFSTSFGQRTIETISKLIASDVRGTTQFGCQKELTVNIHKNTVSSIHNHLKNLRENKLGRSPCWKLDVKSIRKAIGTGKREKHRIISDLWFVRKGVHHFFSIKTVKPNIDQTQAAKGDMLKLKLSNPQFKVYFALPYNPFGQKKEDYKHSPPFKIFDMIQDEAVLIGKEYWDFLGRPNTYEKILEIADSVGTETKEIIENYIHNKKS